MSRIGRKPVPMPANVKVSVADSTIQVEGPKGKLSFNYRSEIDVKVDEAGRQVLVSRGDDERQSRALHGLTRSLIANMVEGVTSGYTKKLEIVGVGYQAHPSGRHPGEQDFAWRPVERRHGRAQHEPVDDVRMALPQELSDRAAHRVADRHTSLDADRAEEGRDVVSTVLQSKRTAAAEATAVPTVVERDHPEVVGERHEAGIQFSAAVAVHPCKSTTTGAPSGSPPHGRTCGPAPGNSTKRPGGSIGRDLSLLLALTARPSPPSAALRLAGLHPAAHTPDASSPSTHHTTIGDRPLRDRSPIDLEMPALSSIPVTPPVVAARDFLPRHVNNRVYIGQ